MQKVYFDTHYARYSTFMYPTGTLYFIHIGNVLLCVMRCCYFVSLGFLFQ